MDAFQIVAFILKLWSVKDTGHGVCPGWYPTSQQQFGMHANEFHCIL
jgi:hypothetical protein